MTCPTFATQQQPPDIPGSTSLRMAHGEQIPLIRRIVCLADTYDALVHARPYKSAWPKSEAIAEIKREIGYQFDPEVVKAFLQIPDVH